MSHTDSNPTAVFQKITLSPGISFNKHFVKNIKNGIVPQSMEDKWRVNSTTSDDNSTTNLSFQRSWTHFEIFRATICKDTDDEESYTLSSLEWNCNPQMYKCSSEKPTHVVGVFLALFYSLFKIW